MAKILLIDDDAGLLEVLTMAFGDAGYEVLTARDGTLGLAMIRDARPAAVVSDVNMSGLDGFALCRRVRAGGDAVPLILLTSRDSEIDETLGLDLGADDYLSKPFSTRVLLVLGTGCAPAFPDFLAYFVEHILVRRVLPQHQVFDDAEQPLALRLLRFFRGEALRVARRVVDHLREDHSPCRCERPTRPPQVQCGRVAVPD